MITIFNGDTRGFKGVSKGYFLQIELQMRDYIREFTGNEWLMFSILMLYMKPDGRATPSEELLLEKSGLQRETVYKLLARLKDKEINGQRILLRYQPIVSGRKQGAVNILFPTDEEIEEYEARYAKREPHTDFPHTDDPDPVPPARLPIKEALSLEDNFKGAEVVNPQSQAPTLQDSLDESVGSHQRIGDSLVKTLGEDPEIEIEMADEAGSSSGNLSDQIAERSKKRSAKPTSKFGRGAATKNKSSLETPTPQGNNSSPHSAAPPKASRAWYASASLASHEMPFAELCWEDAFVRVKAQHPLEFRHFAKVGEAAARELILSALEQLTAEERSGSGFPWLLMKRVAQTVPASRPTMDAGSPNQPQWQEVTLPNGKTRWERWFINPITRQRDVQVQPVDESLPDRGRPTGANQRSRHDADD